MNEFYTQVLDLAERIDGLRDELEQLAAQVKSLSAAREADQAACAGSEPKAEHSTVSLEGKSSRPQASNDGAREGRVIALILIQQVVSHSIRSAKASVMMVYSETRLDHAEADHTSGMQGTQDIFASEPKVSSPFLSSF